MEIREEPDNSWGSKRDGNFSGVLGILQREEADLGLPVGPQPGQGEVSQYSRIHISNGLCFVTLQPDFLPKHLVMLRPLEGKPVTYCRDLLSQLEFPIIR